LGVREFEAVDDHQAILCLARKRHLEAERTNLLVQRRVEVALARTVGLATADEDRRLTIPVTSGAAALLLAVFLAGTRHIGPLASRPGGAAAVFELPRHDAVQDVGARLHTEHRIAEFDIA